MLISCHHIQIKLSLVMLYDNCAYSMVPFVTGVPQEVDSYHALCPLEPLDTPTDQVPNLVYFDMI